MSEDKAKTVRFSRRTVIGATTIAPVAASTPRLALPTDDPVSRCANFLAVDLRIERLMARWGSLEAAAMAAHPKWWDLTNEQRHAQPEGRKMAEIDEVLSRLFRERDMLLTQLPELRATSPAGVVAKIAAASHVIHPEDEPIVHRLLKGVSRDLAEMRCPACARLLTRGDAVELLDSS